VELGQASDPHPSGEAVEEDYVLISAVKAKKRRRSLGGGSQRAQLSILISLRPT
jgi:hypothetical protein